MYVHIYIYRYEIHHNGATVHTHQTLSAVRRSEEALDDAPKQKHMKQQATTADVCLPAARAVYL